MTWARWASERWPTLPDLRLGGGGGVPVEVRRDEAAERRQVVAALLDGDRGQPGGAEQPAGLAVAVGR